MTLHIVLLEPEIPQNTGNIARTCVITNSVLHVIGPIGFSLDEKAVKRAGLDYWDLLDFRYYNNYEEFVEKNPNARIYYATTKAEKRHSDVTYEKEVYVMFGKETAGIPKTILEANTETCIRIPMLNIEKARSLNLSNSVAIAVYEVLRQWDYPGMR
ncbi:tRNA (uridine(34)/cytosine(34)/5-carboxymethylaminomethyluridine(34)-2'-O)-methyltransferase TrmL [Clostridium formicaceticum]|uniref:Putative tRNA (cytidine(34)-2'-O)-methyltransferase n=1 Tax=Clostridium formicaceticum TaxID=1497 RepID=A0AAC9RPB6_9CLOT|nr:tRNA (uridine(34)/cytosine(34)/5-carboxymethylaminomethyluridine(34)-2'-O)-methyltransferase TrmL [Clostridium formicaceticum]AOY77906.1 tRNA (uridine(34)/cytosine(34)/5-carboxymethylaminomethyluridine(34)-2'-O)-methyltransferase TrmL [Clostridium formicaceticum]ARE88523.1 tRNA (cytidine(34)-2'-O)-methyltransferase [Clostridium formicaceticum]